MEENNNVFVLKLNNHKTPKFTEAKGKEWILYGSEHPYYNRYCDYLLELYLSSTMQHALINAKHKYIIGNGIEIDKRGLKVGQVADLIDQSQVQANKYKETLADIASKAVLDRLIFNGSYIEVVWAKNGKTFDFYHMQYNSLRRCKSDTGYWYSNDWSKSDQSEEKTELRFIPDFDPLNPKGSQIYAFKGYTPGTKYYPHVDYKGAIPYIEADIELGNFDLNRIKSGFFVGTILNFSGKPTPDEQKNLEKQLKTKFAGTDATNSILITYSRNKDEKPDVLRLPPDELDTQFQSLKKNVEQNVCTVHGFNPMLAGIKTEGQLGGRSELEVMYQLTNNTVIEPIQTQMENWFSVLLSFKGFGKRLRFVGVKPLNMFTPEQIAADMTQEERREAMGLPRTPVKSSIQQMSSTKSEDELVDEEMKVFEQFGVHEDELILFGQGEEIGYSKDAFSVLEGEVKEIYKSILALLDKDPLMDNDTMAKLLNTKPERIARALVALEQAEAIKIAQGKNEVRKIKVQPEGRAIVEDLGSEFDQLEVRYKYEAKEGLKPIIETTRPFCRRMVSMKRLWTRAEIETLSARMGYNVWTDRGGWWSRKGGDIKTPSCRHRFVSYVVKRKKAK
jgi:hypothetical protein